MALGKRVLIGVTAVIALVAAAAIVHRTGLDGTRPASVVVAEKPTTRAPEQPATVPPTGAASTPGEVPTFDPPDPPPTTPPVAGGPGPGWELMWSPSAAKDGLKAFEGVEDDRAHSDPGVKHIYVADNHFRFDMTTKIRDSSPDRQRNEVKGMNAGGKDLTLAKGETWRLQWSLFIPDSLQATTTFTHIMQLKMPGSGSAPIVTMSLRRVGNVPKIELQAFGQNAIVGRADLAPLQNKWIDTAVEFTISDAGSIRWTLSNGGKTVLDASKNNVDLFLDDRVRPKWGIYRSLGDKSGALRDTFLLLDNMRAYKRQ